MAIPQLRSCCCGCSLKTGTLIIGWLSLISSICFASIYGIAAVIVNGINDDPKSSTIDADVNIFTYVIAQSIFEALRIYFIAMVVLFLISFILSVFLLVGTYQNKLHLVRMWVIVSLTISIIEFPFVIMQLLNDLQPMTIFNFIDFFVQLYFYLVVFSFYREKLAKPTKA